jgi:glycosyltransferase involved in cell wall biosynthesis
LLWQICAYFVVRKLHRKEKLELLHHLTFGTYWMPTFLSFQPLPFIWGPVGGAEVSPRAFRTCFGLRATVYEIARDVVRGLGDLNPFVRLAARKAVLTLSKTEDTKKRLQQLGARHVLVCSEVGLDVDELSRLNSVVRRENKPLRFFSVGRLIHWKGFELAMRAFASLHRTCPEAEYWIIGNGPERNRLEALSQKCGVAEKVRFLGALPRQKVLDSLQQCDVLLHPSLHDSGGWACVEAMAAGRPVICLDLGGPAVQVTNDTGIKVRAGHPDQVVNDLAVAMGRLAESGLRRQLGMNGRERIHEHFSWERKAEFIQYLYDTYGRLPIQSGLCEEEASSRSGQRQIGA